MTLEYDRIVLPLDGSKNSENALVFAAALGARGTLVEGVTMPPTTTGVEFVYYPDNFGEDLEEGAREYLRKVAQPGEEIVVGFGIAAEAIRGAAEELDAGLVVMAS